MPSRSARRGIFRTSRFAAPRLRVGGNPSAVPFRPGSWDVSGPVALYVPEPGDTMAGIAERYMPPGSRWTEIRAFQGGGGQTQWGKIPSTNGTMWFPGDGCTSTAEYDADGNVISSETVCTKTAWGPGSVFRMPEEAKQRMLALLASGEPKSPPTQPNAPGNYPGANPLEPYGLGAPPVTDPNNGGQVEPQKPKKSEGGAGIVALLGLAAAYAAFS